MIGALILLLGMSLIFGLWSFSKMSDYKNNSDAKVAAAVKTAAAAAAAKQKAADDQQNKSPYKVFKGSATYGSVTFKYPRGWSAYVDTTQQNEPINGYFFPGEVPGIQSTTAFALRVELLSTDYSQIAQQFSSNIQSGDVGAKAYLPPKLKGVANVQAGTLFSGKVTGDDTKTGTLLAIRVRDKTLEISTQSKDYLSDFNKIVLASLSFAP